MMLGMVAGILVTRQVIDTSGPSSYAYFAIIISIPALLPFLDLGTGASLVNSIGESSEPRYDSKVHSVFASCIQVSAATAFLTSIVSIILAFFSLWPSILGNAGGVVGANGAAAACLVVFAATVPLMLCQRILLGIGKQPLQILILGLQFPITLIFLFLLYRFDDWRDSGVPAVAYFFAQAVLAIAVAVAAFIAMPTLFKRTWAYMFRIDRSVLRNVVVVAGPMLIQMISVPIALQGARIVLSHRESSSTVAEYSVAAQVYLSILGTIAAAGVALWPIYTRKRAIGAVGLAPLMHSLLFAIIALTVGLTVAVFAGPVFNVVSGGQITVATSLAIAFSLQVCLQAALYPLGMSLMDARGLRLQILPTVLIVPAVLFGVYFSTPTLGSLSPPLSIAVAIAVFQLPVYAYAVCARRNENAVDRLVTTGERSAS